MRENPHVFFTTLCSYTGFTDLTRLAHPQTGDDLTPVEMLRYALDNGLLAPTRRHSIVDVNNTAMWPDDRYYQPAEGVQ